MSVYVNPNYHLRVQVKKAGNPAGALNLPAWSDKQVTTMIDGKMHAPSAAGRKELHTQKQLEKQKQEKAHAHEEKSLAKGKCSRFSEPALAAASKESTPRSCCSDVHCNPAQNQVTTHARCCSQTLMMVLF